MKNKLILGTVQFGLEYGINNTLGKPSKEEVYNTLLVAKDSGISTLDTADQYGNSPVLIGEFKRTYAKEFLVNTKFKVNNLNIREQLDYSLDVLGITAIEVYFYHSFSDLIQYPKVKLELMNLKEGSKIQKIGVSVYTNDEIEIAVNTPEVDVIQIPFNLLDNISHRGYWLGKARDNGKIIQARSAFLQGLFFKDTDSFPPYLTPLKKYVNQLHSIAKECGVTVENLCLSYVLGQQDIDQVIIGVDNSNQLKKNLTYSRSFLDTKIIQEINAIKVIETELLYPINWR
jgi:aryl-alcohol dehydrogenase-like predicted oxidoreductase